MARTRWCNRSHTSPLTLPTEIEFNNLLVIISFPPFVGHTTLVTLCGFAYGMKGFYISASSSLVGAVLVFIVLRFLFRHRLRQWSTQNDKWQALEAVVVSSTSYSDKHFLIPPFREPKGCP